MDCATSRLHQWKCIALLQEERYRVLQLATSPYELGLTYDSSCRPLNALQSGP